MKSIILIQFRTDKSEAHEKECFLRYFTGAGKKLKIINALKSGEDFSRPQKFLAQNRGIILGGSGDLHFLDNKPEKEKEFQGLIGRISPLIKHILEKDLPTLGVCFGYQMLGCFLGGGITNNNSHIGSFPVYLTKDGGKNSLFTGLPRSFIAQFGHRENLGSLPPKTTLLAKTKGDDLSAFLYKKNIYGVQFHPELTPKDSIYRLKLYPEYVGKKRILTMSKNLKPSPYASIILKNFLKIVYAN